MSDGSPLPILVILGLAVAGSIVVGALWPRITGPRRPARYVPPPPPPPIRYVTGPPESGPPTPRFGTGVTVNAHQPDPNKRWATISYVKPDGNDIEDDEIRCNLAGINHMSLTGEHRQDNIRELKTGQPLILVRHHSNPHDAHATLALSEACKDVGYVPAHLADRIARVLDAERPVTAVVDEVDEFTSSGGNRLLGVRVTVTTWKKKPKPRVRKTAGSSEG